MSDNNEFGKSMEQATLKMITKMVKNMEKACLVVEIDAKINCPVDQGTLRASMQHDVNLSATAIVGTISNSEEIAPYVHQGTGIYAVNGDGRKTPWKYEVKSGKYKGWHTTRGQKPCPFLEYAKLFQMGKISKILAGD